MENFKIYNIITGAEITLDEIKAAVAQFFAFLDQFIKGKMYLTNIK